MEALIKKLVVLMLVLSLVFCFTACGDGNGSDEEEKEDAVTEATKEEPEELEEPEEPEEDLSLYYDFALEHDDEFWNINKDWMDERIYYYLADVDHDEKQELVVKIGCGVGVFKIIDGVVSEVFYDRLPDSSGRDAYWVARYDGKDYISYATASSSEYNSLNIVKDGKLEMLSDSMVVNFEEYFISDEKVTQEEYDEYLSGIEYPEAMTIDGLK